jgi:hypothetical protein
MPNVLYPGQGLPTPSTLKRLKHHDDRGVPCVPAPVLSCPALADKVCTTTTSSQSHHDPTHRPPSLSCFSQRPAPSAQRPVCLCLFPYAPPTSARALTPALCACGQDRPADLPSPLCYYLYNTCPLDDIYAPRRKKKEIYYPSVPTGNQQSRSPFCRTCSTC